MRRILLIVGATLLVFSLRAQSVIYTCRYWFDQNYAQAVTTTFGENTWEMELDVGMLPDGLHMLHLHLMDTSMKWSAPQSYLFLKTTVTQPENYVYHCWFDEDFDYQQSNTLSNGYLLLDVADLEDGMHTVNVMLEGSQLSATQSYLFMKIAVENSGSEMQYICWFDQDYSSVQTGPLGSGLFELEVSDLPNGIHTVNVQLDNGTRTAPQTYLFYKQPLGGYGIARWEYWVNDDIANRQITNISPTVDTLDIVSLLTVGHPALRSSCFHFHPNGDAPYINAKNQINFRFYDSELRIIDKSAFYVDEQVEQDIVATVFERNTMETFAAPRNNQITWYKLDAVVGDSLSFVANKACTMQLFAPSGEEVYNVSGPESITLGGLHAWEDGTYYLAVHDVTGSGETISLTYNWVYKYAVLTYDAHVIGNGGCSTITFQGNGYNSLLDVYLINAQNDSIRQIDIGHKSNTTVLATFDFYDVNLGVYDAVFQFYDETIRVNGALEVEEPTPILLTNSVSYPSSFMSGRPVTYSYTITNHGNMSAYGIPIFVFISTMRSGNVTHIKLDGLELPSLIDGISTDSLSENEILRLKEFSDNMSDLHHFFAFRVYDETIGDSINILSNYFYLNIAPLECKVLDITVTATTGAHRPLNVWMTVPNDTVQPLILNERGIRDQYCCVKDKMECVLNITADISGLISNIPGAWGVAGKITECVSSSLSTLSSTIGYWVCREEGDPLPFDYGSMVGNTNSAVSLITACFKKFPEAFKQLQSLLEGRGFAGLRDFCGIAQDINDCVTAFTQTKPGCPPGDDEGGSSDGQTPNDPNDIRGYLSESGSHYMRQEIQNVQYEIEFENDTTLATAAAHTIIVRDTLDATKFDLNSLAARSVTIGDKRLELNGEQTFARTLDMRPELYVIAQVEQDYDPTTGIIQWTIQSLDPMTMEPTNDPNQGVLPVNYYGNGVGFIDYSINLKQAFADGTAISNRAGIIFDQEEVIMTPTWTNIVDAVEPVSYIENVTFEADTLNFNFVSSDNRSGVWYHSLYYRNESTDQDWKVKVPKILENSYSLYFDEYQTTEYLVMAIDSAGNREEKDMAEYIYYYDGPEPICQTIPFASGWNWVSLYIEVENPIEMLETVEADLGANGQMIKNSQTRTEYDSEWGWFGDLDDVGMTNEQMYKIQVSAPCTLSLEGVPANAAEHPITINPGWNWIGFPSAVSMSLADAFAGFAQEGDKIKNSQTGTEYDEEWGWFGDFETLEPGQGYMYYSASSVPRTLVFPTSAK